MAHLLGSKYCIESLSKDVGDLQTAVVDILSRSGPVRCPSWKYPDRQSMDVDVNDLLELYTYSDDAEESQITHIVLLEMVIDRMVLLLQAVAQFLDGMLNFGRGLSAKNTGSFNSVGLVVKKYWNKMVHLNTVIQQLHSEVKTKSRKIADMENTIIKLQSQVQHLENSPPSNNTVNDNDIFDKIPPPNFHMQKSIQISRDEYTKSTQTVETAFIPCESCHGVQNSLRDVGKLVSSVCESQGLPSTLAKHMEQIESIKWLSGNDVTRWTTAQNKDLTKIDQHLTQLMANIEPLQNELQVERKQHKIALERMNEAEKKAKLERETQRVQQRQYENRLKDMERSKQTEVEEQKMEYSRLMEVRDKMEGQIEQMQAEQEKQQGLLKQLEEAKLQLISDYENDSAHKTQVELLSVDITKLQTEVKNVNLLLNKEKAKNRSVNKHSEMLQMKQSSLVGRIDVIDRENDELREQMNEMEESRDKLSEQLEETEMEKKQLNETLASEKRVIISLEKNKARLETSIRELENNIEDSERQLKVAQDRERLMIEYPDLNGPVNRDITGTGDLVIDMENQVSANMLRIQVLETQNSKLRNSVMKLLETQGQKRDKVQYESSKPVTLWRPDDATEYQEQLASNRTQTNQYTDDSESDRFSLGYESSPTVRSPSPEKVQATSATNIGKKQPSNIRVAWSEHMNSRKTPTKRMTDVKSLISGRSAAGKESSGKHTVLGGGFVVGKAPSRPSSGTKSTKSRPTSAKPSLQAVPSSSSIAAYKKLKDAGMIKTDANTKDTARLQSGRPAPASGRNTNQSSPMISCVKCDKMFTCKSDLEIHKSYCFGGI